MQTKKVCVITSYSIHYTKLYEGPQSFRDLMEATGSRDGRDVLIALDAVRREVGLERLPDGRYRLRDQNQT